MKMLITQNKAIVVGGRALVLNDSARYRRLDKITFQGNAYFDTMYICKTYDLEVEIVCSVTNTGTGPNVMCGFLGATNLPRWMIGTYQTGWLTSLNNTSYTNVGKDMNLHTFVNKAYLNDSTPYWSTYIDGDPYKSGVILSSNTYLANTLSSYIGGRNNNGAAGNFANGDFVSLKIREGGVLVQEIYPVIRIADNVIGLYDKTADAFLEKMGSGTVIPGVETGEEF